MKISPDEVAAVAKLARLKLDPEKLDMFSHQLGDILEHMEELNRLDTEGVKPLYSPVEHTTVLRPDRVEKEYSRDQVLSNAPESDGQFFIVPKIVTGS